MIAKKIIGRLLAILVIAGLALAPLVTPAAGRAGHAEMSDMEAMSGDMPCCPDEQKIKDCQDCPLMAMCMLKTAQAGPSPKEAILLRHAIRTRHSFSDDVPAAGLVRPPPDHPPRSLI
jgi:hypothetical protein